VLLFICGIFVLSECEKATSSSMWLCVFLGNMLRGVGETPVMPLGLSYLDDFSKQENIAFYLGMIDCLSIILPILSYIQAY